MDRSKMLNVTILAFVRSRFVSLTTFLLDCHARFRIRSVPFSVAWLTSLFVRAASNFGVLGRLQQEPDLTR